MPIQPSMSLRLEDAESPQAIRTIGSAVVAVAATAWILLNGFIIVLILNFRPEGVGPYIGIAVFFAGLASLGVFAWFSQPDNTRPERAWFFCGGLVLASGPLFALFLT